MFSDCTWSKALAIGRRARSLLSSSDSVKLTFLMVSTVLSGSSGSRLDRLSLGFYSVLCSSTRSRRTWRPEPTALFLGAIAEEGHSA